MDDSQNIQSNQSQQTSQQMAKAEPVVQQPVSQPVKEAEPIPTKEVAPVEYIKKSEPEPTLSPEIVQAGVQASTPQVPVDEKIGIRPAADVTPVTESQSVIEKVMTRQEIQQNLKQSPSESPRWLAELLKMIWTKLTLSKKETHRS